MPDSQPSNQQLLDAIMSIHHLLDGTTPPSAPERMDDLLLHALTRTDGIESVLSAPNFAPEAILEHCRVLKIAVTNARTLLWEQINQQGGRTDG
jgi:hypothetical protein